MKNTKKTTESTSIALSKQEKMKDAFAVLFEQRDLALETLDADNGTLLDRSNSMKPIPVEFARARDSLLLLRRGIVRAAILGSDIVEEYQAKQGENKTPISLRQKFDVAACRICIAAPAALADRYRNDPKSLNGLRFATSYPETLKRWLADRKIVPSEIVMLDGGVESSIRRGLADVVMDIVQTGAALKRNNLEIVTTVKNCSAGLYTVSDQPMTDSLTSLIFRLAERPRVTRLPGIH